MTFGVVSPPIDKLIDMLPESGLRLAEIMRLESRRVELTAAITATEPSMHFWVSNKGAFPILYKEALYWLAVPSSSASAERDFGYLRALYECHRTSLNAESVEQQLLLMCNRMYVEKEVDAFISKLK